MTDPSKTVSLHTALPTNNEKTSPRSLAYPDNPGNTSSPSTRCISSNYSSNVSENLYAEPSNIAYYQRVSPYRPSGIAASYNPGPGTLHNNWT